MSFTTPPGTYGGRRPGALFKRLSRMPSGRLRSKGGKAAGLDALVLTTIGRTSGQPRSTVVARFPGQDGSWIVVASAGGSADHPAWYYNLAAHPDQAVVELAGERIEVVARELHGDEREQEWARITQIAPRFESYVSKTDRLLPVIRLSRRS